MLIHRDSFIRYSRANFLVDGLLEMLRVHDRPDLTGRIRRPVRRHDLHFAFARVHPTTKNQIDYYVNTSQLSDRFTFRSRSFGCCGSFGAGSAPYRRTSPNWRSARARPDRNASPARPVSLIFCICAPPSGPEGNHRVVPYRTLRTSASSAPYSRLWTALSYLWNDFSIGILPFSCLFYYRLTVDTSFPVWDTLVVPSFWCRARRKSGCPFAGNPERLKGRSTVSVNNVS